MNGKITRESVRNALAATVPELLFVLLPIGVTALVYVRVGRGWEGLRESPEWAFAAVILAGQTSMKLLFAGSRAGLNKQKLHLMGSIIFFLAVFAVMVLSGILEDELRGNPPHHWASATQLALVAVTALAFLFFGVLAYVLSEK